jgi:hypothetical protein
MKKEKMGERLTGGFTQAGAQSRATIQRNVVSLRPCRAVVDTPACREAATTLCVSG